MKKTMKQLVVAAMIGTMGITPVTAYVAPMTAYAKTTLEAPSNAHWGDKKDEDEGYYAHWDEVENAKKYEVYIYYINDDSGYTKVSTLTTNKTSVNLVSKLTKGEQDYTFRVRAVGTGSYTTGSWSDYAEEVYYDKSTSSSTSTGSAVNTTSTDSTGPSAGPSVPTTNNTSTSGPSAQNTTVGGWRQNAIGWWYATNDDGTAWHANCWQWLDGNHDGIAECYYFDVNGYALTNTVTPDGYTVNADGAWTVNGVVQVKTT